MTAAQLNAHVRDNLNFLKGFLGDDVKVKAASEQVAASTTLQNDDHLVFAMLASEIWLVEGLLIHNGNGAGNIKFAWDLPASCTANTTYHVLNTAQSFQPVTDESSRSILPTDASQVLNFTQIVAFIQNGANAGNAQMRWAQDSASGTTTLFIGSYIRCRKVFG